MISRVHGRGAFDELRRTKLRVRRGVISIAHVPCDDAQSDAVVGLAFALPRRIGSAVVRNRIRRRVRAVFTQLDAEMIPSGNYLVMARPDAATMPFTSLVSSVAAALEELGRRRAK